MTVVDASFVIAFLTEEDRTADATAFMASHRLETLTAPLLLDWEATNVLCMKLRRELVTPEVFSRLLTQFRTMKVGWDNAGSMDEVANLSRRHDLTVYDAAYLELAIRLAASLATFDRDLRKAATAEGVNLAV